jgi:SAM-dependent methyltransferase
MKPSKSLLLIAPEFALPVAVQPCAFCGGNRFETTAMQDRHLLRLVTAGCTSCGLLQTNPRPDAAGLGEFYSRHYRKLYEGVIDPSAEYVARLRKDERLRYTVAHLTSVIDLHERSVLLDYGCGEGSLFVALRAAGFRGRLVGVEPNPNFALYAGQAGDADVRASVDGVDQVDVAVLNHVLEHLADPLGVLRDIRRRMTPRGWLYVDVPDADRYEHVRDLHLAHILHFTARTLARMVGAAGFEVVTCEPHDPPNHPRSLRLLAHPGRVPTLAALPLDPRAERATWEHLRVIDARSWRWALRRRLAAIGPLRAVHRALRQRPSATPRG